MAAIVDTRLGKLVGQLSESDSIFSFKGIPFAQPPVGELRFRPPQPAEAWSEPRDAREFGHAAPQFELQLAIAPGMEVGPQSEDCLSLNVFTPGLDDARRPVMVWLHGGAFSIGSGSQRMYDPTALVERGDVVVVTINYRLGALGFLDLESVSYGRALARSLGSSANLGLLDQVAALVWVRENIAAFGGDPEAVTIFGESAGGMSVGCLLGLPAARGLFQRAIAMSGAAHSALGADERAEVTTAFFEEMAARRGCAVEQVDAATLRSAPVSEILEVQGACDARFASAPDWLSFRPTVDGVVLPESPIDAIRKGMSKQVQLMAGCTRDEWKLFGFMDPRVAKIADEASLLKSVERRVTARDDAGGSLAHRIVDAYRELMPGASPRERFFAIESDRRFRLHSLRLVEAQCLHQPNTFAYLFTWESPMAGGGLGACHGVDIPFVFGSIGSRGATVFVGDGPEARSLMDRVMDAWLQFARTGRPAHPGLDPWPGYDPERRATMILGPAPHLEDDPHSQQRRAWGDHLAE